MFPVEVQRLESPLLQTIAINVTAERQKYIFSILQMLKITLEITLLFTDLKKKSNAS